MRLFKKNKKKNIGRKNSLMETTITIGNVEVPIRYSARILRMYYEQTGRDFVVDMSKIQNDFYSILAEHEKIVKEEGIKDTKAELGLKIMKGIDHIRLQDIFYVMAKHADKNITEDIEEWLEQFENNSFIFALSDLLLFVITNDKPINSSKKKVGLQRAK